jgi:hypothetical protein
VQVKDKMGTPEQGTEGWQTQLSHFFFLRQGDEKSTPEQATCTFLPGMVFSAFF